MGFSFLLGMGLGSSVDKTIKHVGTGVKKLGKEITAVQQSGDFKLGKGLEELRGKTREANREFKAAKKRLAELKDEAEKSGKVSANLARRLDQAERKVKTLSRSTTNYRSKLRDQVIAAQDAGHSIKSLTAEYGRLGRQVDQLNRKQQGRLALGQGVRSLRKGVESVNTYAVVGAMAFTSKAAIDFEDSFAGFEKVASGPEAKIKGMAREFKRLGNDIPIATAGLIDIGTAAAQSNIPLNEIIGFTGDAGRMGTAFDMTGEKSGTMMTAWRNGMGLTQEQVVRLGDAVNHLSNNTAAEAADLGELIQRQGAIGKTAGFSAIEFAALGSAMLAGGAKMEIAATASKNLSTRLTMGAAATKEQRDAFNELGLDAEDVAAHMQEDAPAAVLSVISAIKQLPKEMQSGIMVKLFGQESLGAIAPLVENTNLLTDALTLVSDQSKYAGSMMEEYEKKLKTTKSQTQLLANASQSALGDLGKAALPILNNIAQTLTPIISGLGEWAEKNQWLAQTAFALGGALLGIKAGMFIASPLIKMFKFGRSFFKGGKGGGLGGGAVPVEVVNGGLGGGLGGGDGFGLGGGKGAKAGKFGFFGRLGKRLGGGRLGSALGKAGKLLGKGFRPLGMALSLGTLASGVMAGDARAAGSSVGDIGGGLGGGALGAALGTAILPGIGTAVGGLIGSMAGGGLGSWIGDKIGGWFGGSKNDSTTSDRLEEVSKQAATASAQIPDITLHQTFDIKGGDKESIRAAIEAGNKELMARFRKVMDDYAAEQRRLRLA